MVKCGLCSHWRTMPLMVFLAVSTGALEVLGYLQQIRNARLSTYLFQNKINELKC